jgi:putative nucleotidyltransferase with HDIG domain
MDKAQLKKIEGFAENLCKQYKDDPHLWDTHVRLVRKYALILADIEKADKEVVEIAAILHDIGKCKGKDGHEKTGYELAKDFVGHLDLPKPKKELILKCILKHSSKYANEDNEIEVKVLNSADGLSVISDEKLEQFRKESVPKGELLVLFNKIEKRINLKSARKLAEPQLRKLKLLIE